ncbi:SdpA family antimicrobial peptide system protein [Chryseobacterium gleum]|uniref:SdpA family antimicrobial peptide system protein n=1 Tax=Chryseobacterium gleum TaxID=250 RepID=UPI0028A8AB9E|nr:SdpA family antimicrobial peptide system protein [Chryseobacterium gleum]
MLHKIKNLFLNLRYTVATVCLGLFAIILFIVVLISSIPFNPIQYKFNYVNQVYTYAPQGWAFFTREAKEDQVYIYKIENNKLKKISQKHANISNFVGLSRKVSKMTMEVEIIATMLDKKKFPKTTWNYDENLYGKIPDKFITIKNLIKSPILCGDYLIVYHSIVPWAWSKSAYKTKMPAKVIKVRITCQN